MAAKNQAPVTSTTAASAACAFTDSMPLSRSSSVSYISLWPIISPLAAFNTKYGLPLFEVRVWKRSS